MENRRDLRIPRERMVEKQLLARGISDQNVLQSMLTVPRHLFLPEALESLAYTDAAQPIGYGQTISQPYIVAYMSELLEAKAGMTVLEIGTGSGYQSAVLASMGLHIFTIERIRELYFNTKKLFSTLSLNTIRTKLDDGTLGWEDAAPFDRIIVTAGGITLPEPLTKQLADNGRMIIPLGEKRQAQRLVIVDKINGKLTQTYSKNVAFVDLVGEYGY